MFRYLAICAALAFVLALPGAGSACPLCKEAISSSDGGEEGEEINHLPAAYNRSIYLMVSVPYILLGSVGFLVYRGCKKNALLKAAQEA